jgi:hypothetical protein
MQIGPAQLDAFMLGVALSRRGNGASGTPSVRLPLSPSHMVKSS